MIYYQMTHSQKLEINIKGFYANGRYEDKGLLGTWKCSHFSIKGFIHHANRLLKPYHGLDGKPKPEMGTTRVFGNHYPRFFADEANGHCINLRNREVVQVRK